MFCRLGDTVGPFVLGGKKSPVPKSEVIFREVMTHLITHQGGFTRGVVEHPRPDPCAEGVPAASARGDFRAAFHAPIRDIRAGRDL